MFSKVRKHRDQKGVKFTIWATIGFELRNRASKSYFVISERRIPGPFLTKIWPKKITFLTFFWASPILFWKTTQSQNSILKIEMEIKFWPRFICRHFDQTCFSRPIFDLIGFFDQFSTRILPVLFMKKWKIVKIDDF